LPNDSLIRWISFSGCAAFCRHALPSKLLANDYQNV
jgi:hypothetical protein